jgi:hypothetical protein
MVRLMLAAVASEENMMLLESGSEEVLDGRAKDDGRQDVRLILAAVAEGAKRMLFSDDRDVKLLVSLVRLM